MPLSHLKLNEETNQRTMASDSEDDEQLPSSLEADENEARSQHRIHPNTLLDKIFYIDRDPFMKALQDPGCINPASKEERKIHSPKLKTIANKIFDKLKTGKFPDIPGNKTRVSPIIVNCILKLRKVVGIHEVNEVFRTFVSNTNPTEIFIIHNHEDYFGYNRLLKEIHFYFDRKTSSSSSKALRRGYLNVFKIHPHTTRKDLNIDWWVRSKISIKSRYDAPAS